jgi:hypothetical protein
LSESIWGKIEYNKNNEPVFKVAYPELEYDKRNVVVPDPNSELMNYKQFLEWKFKFKTEEEIPNEDDIKAINDDLA